jgi:hypothetical protein
LSAYVLVEEDAAAPEAEEDAAAPEAEEDAAAPKAEEGAAAPEVDAEEVDAAAGSPPDAHKHTKCAFLHPIRKKGRSLYERASSVVNSRGCHFVTRNEMS